MENILNEEQKREVAAVIKDAIAKSDEKVEGLEVKIKTLEDAPVKSVISDGKLSGAREYKGMRLDKQLVKFRGNNSDFTDVELDNVSKMFKELLDMGGKGSIKAAAEHIEGVDAQGGYLVLDVFSNMVEQLARESSVMIQLCKNISISNTDTYKFPKELTVVDLSWDAEGTVTKKDATWAQGSVAIKRLSGYVAISNELLADAAYDIVGDLTGQFGYAMGQEIDNQVLNGTGSPFIGVLGAGSSLNVKLADDAVWSDVTADIFSEAIATMSTNDAANATYVLGKMGAHYVRTLKDSTGAPIFQAIADNGPDKVYGRNLVVANNVNDAVGETLATAYGVLGDFSKYLIVNRIDGLDVLVDPYSDSVSNNTRFIYSTRKGLVAARTTAFCSMSTGDAS